MTDKQISPRKAALRRIKNRELRQAKEAENRPFNEYDPTDGDMILHEYIFSHVEKPGLIRACRW